MRSSGSADEPQKAEKKYFQDKARQAMGRFPPALPPDTDATTATLYFSAQLEQAKFLYADAGELHVIVGEACGPVLDEAPANVAVGQDQDPYDEQHERSREPTQGERRDAQRAAHQNAWPRPM